MRLLSNSVAAHPYQNQTWVPPPPRIWTWKSTKRWSPVTSLKIFVITNLYSTSYRYRLETWNLHVKIVISHLSKPKPGKMLIFCIIIVFFFVDKKLNFDLYFTVGPIYRTGKSGVGYHLWISYKSLFCKIHPISMVGKLYIYLNSHFLLL